MFVKLWIKILQIHVLFGFMNSNFKNEKMKFATAVSKFMSGLKMSRNLKRLVKKQGPTIEIRMRKIIKTRLIFMTNFIGMYKKRSQLIIADFLRRRYVYI